METRLASGALSGRLMLAEALLDLGLLSQASVVVGSMYSNFGRLALQLTGSAAYESFDAYWCPYHTCQAGCNDVDRLCDQPLQLGESELSRGQRGGFEPFGVRPRRLKPPNASGLIEETTPARRAWVRLMLRLVGSKESRDATKQPAAGAGGTKVRGTTTTGTGIDGSKKASPLPQLEPSPPPPLRAIAGREHPWRERRRGRNAVVPSRRPPQTSRPTHPSCTT